MLPVGAIFERCLILTVHQLLELFVADPSFFSALVSDDALKGKI